MKSDMDMWEAFGDSVYRYPLPGRHHIREQQPRPGTIFTILGNISDCLRSPCNTTLRQRNDFA